MLTPSQMVELTEALKEEFSSGKLEEIVATLNRTGKLEEFLGMIGLDDLLHVDLFYNPSSHGKIAVLGAGMSRQRHLLGVAKQLGLEKDRFEFCLDYDDTKTFCYAKLRNLTKYAAIVAGQMPHKTRGTGNYDSAITAMEKDQDYPPVFRTKKITNSSFRAVLQKMFTERVIA